MNNMKGKYSRDLTKGPIIPLLVKLTWPMMFGVMGMVVFNMVDTFYVGRLGTAELAAIGYTFPVVMIVSSLAMGMGIGTASLISRMIHNEEKSVIQQYSVDALSLSLLIIIFFVSIGQLTIDPLFRLLGAKTETLPLIRDYMVTWYWGVIFVVIPMVGNNILRGTGDTLRPGMIMVFAALVNIVLDPFLIFGIGPFPRMELKGAALATVISRGAGLAVTMFILVKKEKLLALYEINFRKMLRTWKNILYVAGPATLGMLITPLSIAILTRLIAEYGKEAVAAFGVVSRLESFGMMLIHALASTMTIFAGQNWGRANYSRLRQGVWLTAKFSLIWGLLLFVAAMISAPYVASVFSQDPAVIKITTDYLRIVSFSYGFLGIMMISVATFNGINKPIISMSITFLRMLVVYVPLAWFASRAFGLNGIFWAGLAANIIVGLFGLFLFTRKLKPKITGN